MRQQIDHSRPINTQSVFCVYEHWRPDKQVCFYVGKGKLRRARAFCQRNSHHTNIVRKLLSIGLQPEIRIVAAGLSEDAAFAMEIERIGYWRAAGIRLANKTNGGEGPSGFKRTQEHDAALLRANTGRIVPVAVREKIRRSLIGQPFSQDRRDRIRQKALGRKLTEETKEKLSRRMKEILWEKRAKRAVALRDRRIEQCRKMAENRRGKPGRKLSDEHKENLRKSRLGVKATGLTRAKQQAAKLGKKRKPFTDETIRRMRVAAKLREQRKREIRPGL